MADELDALLERVDNDGLRAELRDHVERLRRKRQFGLVFESHLPERVRLPDHPIRRGSKVVRRDAPPKETPQEVLGVKGDKVVLGADGEAEEVAPDDLVVVAEFGEPIYPGLRRLGSIDRGGDKPAHVVIKGENYHALEALRFSHAGKVDCIYIDPPYNTGARDWKYNNDYVEGDDLYRHSKWLAFMERRLLLAKELLNPEDSVLIVTIDEKEYLRLGLLLERTFPEGDIQMVTSVINRAGSPRSGRFSRVDEYIYYVFMGGAQVAPWSSTMLPDTEESGTRVMPTVWFTAVRRGSGASRAESKNLFYPVIIDAETGALRRVGDPIPRDMDRNEVPLNPGELAIWPMGADGGENRWRFSADLMRTYFANGTARLGKRDPVTGLRPVTYLQPGTLKNIENGTFLVTGRTEEGALKLGLGETAKAVAPRTVWSLTGHFARDHGSHLIGALVGNRKFPFPKALYAVEDALRFVVRDKPEAVVLDFFAGSGTTAHAVMRLNKQNGGRLQCISVTNNEVSADEQKRLREAGLRPGDPEWEALGICDYITKPRIQAAITGRTPDGDPINGDYKFTDEFPMADGFEENVEFLELKYLDIEDVELALAFESVAPLLWLRAGGTGPVIDRHCDDSGAPMAFELTDRYGVLFDPDHWRAFIEKLPETVMTVFVVTDSPSVFASVAAELPTGVDVVRLYENYLSTFAINRGS